MGVGRPSPGEKGQARPAEARRGPPPAPQHARSGVGLDVLGVQKRGPRQAAGWCQATRSQDGGRAVQNRSPGALRHAGPHRPSGDTGAGNTAPNSHGSGTPRDSVVTHHSLGDRALSWRKDTSVPTHRNGGREGGGRNPGCLRPGQPVGDSGRSPPPSALVTWLLLSTPPSSGMGTQGNGRTSYHP